MAIEAQQAVQTQITQVTEKIQRLQRSIAAVKQPASQLELFELQRLGRRYGTLIAELKRLRQETD